METPSNPSNGVAIIGMAGRFPGASDIERFWENIAAGLESVTFFSESELREAGVEAELLADPAYVRARAVVDGVEMFDAAFFDMSPREAEVIDPQQRLLLECAWEVLERAGHDPRRFPGPIGVFAGASLNTYLLSNLQHNPEVMEAAGLFQAMVGSCVDFLATRISYKLGLRGPSLTVQTACSTSLVTVHLAVQSLLNSECDMALAGGVRLLVPRKGGHLYQPGGIFSRDGHCRAFDAAATGITEGEGCGLVLLKRLADALADGDHIHAVILGSAINNDGSAKMGFTMPSVDGQTAVIAMAQALAGIEPETIGFIEAHGTGTPLGDPIEVAALERVFSTAAGNGHSCALGSLKTNLGHLDTAAGVASLVKAALAVEKGVIPPSLHFERPNPQIDFASGRFYVPVQATPWPGRGPRRAGVSSYGFGGTNAHVVLEEAPRVPPGSASRPHQLLTLSAPTPSALERISRNLTEHLRRHSETDLADVAYTLQVGRAAFDHRRTAVCEDVADAIEVLSTLDPKRVLTRAREAGDQPVFFLFPGQGTQYPGMGAGLYRNEPVFRHEVDRCAEILHPWLGLDLRQVLYPAGQDPEEAAERLDQTALAQPALFVVEHALARLWMAWGVRPAAMLGHSIGEYVAACLAGVFPLEDALRLVAERGRLMQEMPGGSMLAVSLPETEVRPLLAGLCLAAVNAPAMCVVAGGSSEIEELAARLAERGIQTRRLHTSHAFHSAAMEPLLPSFEAVLAGLRLGAPEIPFLSNLTGTWIRPEEAAAPRYWLRHLRQTVRFSDGLQALLARPSAVFLEVGPGQALTSLVRQHRERPAAASMFASLPAAGDAKPADAGVLRALGQLWMAGVEIDWAGFHSGGRRLRVPLPTYPFERQRYWVEPAGAREQVRRRATDGQREVAEWFWVPLWHQALPPQEGDPPADIAAGNWLVFADETGLGERLAAHLGERGGKVAVVRAGESFQEVGQGDFVVRPAEMADYGELLDRLAGRGMAPTQIVHLWSVVGPREGSSPGEEVERDQERGFFSLSCLVRALGERRPAGECPPLHVGIISTGVHRITGAEDLAPARATLLGPAMTLPQEYPRVTSTAIDLSLLPPGSQQEKRLIELLLAELAAPAGSVVAYRGTDRWMRGFEPLRLGSPRRPLPVREAGTYLITGGLGGVGLELADFLARSARVRLVLASRTPFAEREEWPVLARGEDYEARVARRLLALETAGAEVWTAATDVTDAAAMRRLFGEVRRRFGRVDGVIHAAGLAGGGLLQNWSLAEAAAVLAPKMRGTLVLAELLARDAPDFLVLCSSLDTLVGGPGRSDSTAANAFLDAFAHSRAGELPVLAINWSPWRGVGLSAPSSEAGEGLDPERAVEAFRRILTGGYLPQIAVSARPVSEVLERRQARTAAGTMQAESPARESGHARPDLATLYVAPQGELEERLAAIWADALGLDRVGTADDFFELGGHSLLGTRLVARVREAFGVEVPLGQLFEAPTVADLSAFIAAQLVLPGAAERQGIPRSPRGGVLPLSFAQERLWFLDQLEPGSATYNLPMVLRMRGPFDVTVLEAALGEIVRRHEALRTTFRMVAGVPEQVVSASAAVFLPVIDLEGLPAAAGERETERIAGEEAQRPFDLGCGPLLRTTVLRQESTQHTVLFNMHHIVSDGWSYGVLVQEFGTLYTAFQAGRPSRLPELAIQYADYAAWQRQHLSGAFLESEIAWWRGQLAGVPPALDLPLDHPRSAADDNRAALHEFAIASADVAALASLSRSQGATLFMTLLAGLAGLLQRYTGQDDLAVATPIAGRLQLETEPLIGLFINTLVLRIDLAGDPGFEEVVGRVRERTLSAYAHQEMPFARLVEDLAPERSLTQPPLAQVMFVLQNTPKGLLELPQLTVTGTELPAGSAKFDLLFDLTEIEQGLMGRLEYNRSLFEESTVARFRGHFVSLLRAIAADPGKRLSEAPLLSADELHQVLREWNDVPSWDDSGCVQDLIEAQARRTPEATAILTADGTEISYGELARRAEGLASRLRELGVRPDDCVGVCLERSWEGAVSLLAVLKSGGCYLPLDPAYPRERLGFMLSDAAVPVLITHDRLAGALPPHEARIISLGDGRDGGWPEERKNGGLPAVGPDHLSYVIYTSGSTGRPKGVALPHRTLANLIDWQIAASAAPAGRTLQFASPSFDVSLQETLATWAAGGMLIQLSEEERTDVEALLRRLCDARVERLFLPFVALQQLAEAALSAAALPPLREVVTAGEQLQITPEVRALFSRLSGCVLRNQYGPSETHVVTEASLTSESPGEVATWPALPPIGRPIAATEVLLLDRRGALVPIGVPGEMFLGGAGPARGYLGRPDLTAERFVPDPWGHGGRLYRTGDLARLRTSGEIEFLGRIDHQVKIRGFRIELGEIEAALAEHPGICQAVLVVRDDLPGGRGLLAFVVPDGQSLPATAELRQRLRERLPDYMVPGHFACLDRLPVTPSGKVDRRALAQLEVFRSAAERGASPSSGRSPAEELLAGVFAELLQVEGVTAGQSFFELGGHSLLATRLVSRLRQVFGVELPVRTVFEAPTVAALAAAVEQALRKGQEARIPPLVRAPQSGPFPLSFAQQRLWFVDQLQPGSAAYNIPAAMRLVGELDPAALAAALSEVVRRHQALRTTFERGPAGEPVQRIHLGASVPLLVIDLRRIAAAEAESMRLARQEASRPFRLATGPVLRVSLVLTGERQHTLLLTLHHIVSDGWSLGVLIRELGALYPAALRREASPLPDLPVQYTDFAVWQRQWLTGDVLEAELAYWRRQLAGVPPALELPTDRPRPAVQTSRGASLSCRLGELPPARLRELATRRGVTPFMFLLAGFQTLLVRVTGQHDVSVGTPTAGRNHARTEDLIGFFVNTLVLRSDLSAAPSFEVLLERVRETTLDAHTHQNLPFEKLVEELAPERNLGRTPLFQVMFALQNTPFEGLELPGLQLEALAVDSGTAKFELTLSLAEDRGTFLGFAEYNRDLFEAATVRRLVHQWETLLQSALGAPESNVFDLELMGAAERRQVLHEWSGAGLEVLRGRCIHELFREQAELRPDALAVSFRDEAWTYGELERRSGLLAGRLRSLGVGPEVPVGLLTERSLEMVAGLLGILEAGGAYVPLDLSHPAERLGWLLRDTGAPLVLVQERLSTALPAGPWRAVGLEELCRGPGQAAEPASGGDLSPGGLAYVLYTSGSTGRPKGVAVPHRAVVRLVRGRDDLCIDAEEVWLQLAPLAFDASTLEIWGPLANGGRLEVFGPHKPTIEELGRTVESAGVTSLWLTAGLFHQVAESDLRPFRGLRKLLAGGDVLSPGHVRRALHELPGCRVINGYGPTENTTFTCCQALASPSRIEGPVPIGRPIAHTRVYLVDRRGRPVPPGIPGELLAGGDGLARGYHGRPDLTAELFVPNPFAGLPGERLYRTGDLARWRLDGSIEFLGRIDQQVKIRGFRVEPGEIEAALTALAGVHGAAVVAREDTPGDRRLVAYVAGEVAADVLLHALRERLPEYMMPASVVLLAALPLTPNGKVDRKALPAPDQQPNEEGLQVPRTPVEGILAGIWAEVLGIERVGVNESFFRLGGHSLLAIQVMSRLRDAFGVELPLHELFEAPTLADFAARIEAALQAGEGQLAPPLVPLAPHLREGPLPLSFAQQRLWFIDRLQPGPAYNLPVALRVHGPLDVAVMAAALSEIARRHEALRTTFPGTASGPVQVIAASNHVPLAQVNLMGLPGARRWPQAFQCLREEVRRSFDLTRGPLLRCLLVRLKEREHLLLLNMHHIVSDGWSMGVLVREIWELFPALRRGRNPTLGALPIQYADFASWQRQWLQGEVLAAQLRYWKEQLRGIPAVLELPTDRPRQAVQTFAGASFACRLPQELGAQLQAWSRRVGATLFMTLLSAFQELLGRYSGQLDLTVGTPVAGRTHRQLEDLIGFFVNMLVVRADLAGEPSFTALTRRVRETLLAAYVHQDLPFESLVEELHPDRSLSYTPLYQVVFALQNTPIQRLEIEDLSCEPVGVETATAKFDLTVMMQETERGLQGAIEYNTDLFDRATVQRLMGHWEMLLAGAVASPERRLSDFVLVTPAERAQLLLEWNDTGHARSPRPLVHELFARHAALHPEATAVTSPEGRLSYGAVERRANRLAWHLRGLGIGPEVLVAICADRTLLRVVGILAVLKAGGAYVSLDPTYPQERLAFLLEDSGAPVLLTETRYTERLPRSTARLLCLEEESECREVLESKAPRSGVGPEHLAYVVYTSGSTGRPKGVAIPHAGLINLVQWHQERYQIRPDDRATQIASPAFDASIWELWPYLTAGASVHIPDEETRLSPSRMLRWWAEQRITMAFLMTPLAEGLLDEQITADPALEMRALLVGGDRLHRRPAPGVGFRVINHYGPAEYTVVSTATEVPARGGQKGFPSIGRAIDNTRVYVLDRWLNPAPVGVPGELCVAGAGLARGYHERPDLTAEKFVPDPFGGQPGARMYRTADRARCLPSGDIDFLGRLDHQVKVRGMRIELGEIETVLGRHPDLQEAVVVVREDRPGNRHLVAYLVAGERGPGGDELRDFLSERLPEYMVPSAFVTLDCFPLTPNGKVDRQALPAPQWPTALSCAGPRTAVEEVLAGLFAEILGLERVGIEDDFFRLGGHSLSATRLVSRLREVLGREVPLRSIFEAPTVTRLADSIASPSVQRSVVPLRPAPRTGDLPLSFSQQRLWFLEQIEPGNAAYNIPLALRLNGQLDPRLLAEIFSGVVRRHEVLRTTFTAREGVPIQVIAAPGPLPMPLVDLSGLPGEEREEDARALAVCVARRPFDLQRGPLLRLLLVRLAAADHLLLLTLHHIVSDGWSMGVLLREIAASYEALSLGRPPGLPALPVQYADFAVWQRHWLQGEVLDAELEGWRRRLAGAPPVLELSLDRPRPLVRSHRGARRPVVLPPPLTAGIGRLCRRQNVTSFMALVAAWAVLLGRHAGQDDVLVGAPIAGRNRREIENLIGFFVNTVVLRSDLSGNPRFAELLAQVRRTALDAFTHQDLPFERLVEDLAPERSLAHTPLFQVMLVLQNVPIGDLSLPGLRISPVDVESGFAKFDLSLTLTEGPEGMAGALTYASDLFDPSTAERLVLGFQRLLGGMAGAHSDAAVLDLEILSQAERRQLLIEWSGADERASDVSVYALFERRARWTPDAVAVVFEEEWWSYGETLRRSLEVAASLGAQGVRPGNRVAIQDRRSAERIARVLGVLACGAAYAAIDPDQPRTWRARILEDLAPVWILPPLPPLPAEEADLWAGAGADPLSKLDEVARAEASFAASGDVPRAADVEGPAYVVYTSGSTGRPKGILAHHRGAATYLEWVVRNYGLSANDVALQLAPLTFDAALRDTFAPLAAGGRIVIVADGMTRDPAALLELMEAQGVTCLPSIVPSLLRLLVEEATVAGRRVPSLRLILASGEKLYGTDAAAVRKAFGERISFVNQYGASEATMSSTWYPVTTGDEGLSALPVGRPAASSQVFLLDPMLRPVPRGSVGEICFGGPGLTFGYLGQPDRTAESFVPHSFGAPGERLYRTGDRGRYRPNGVLELLGRIDFQLKVRGQRLEPGEVEAALRSHPAVREAVVAAHGERELRLAAWLVAGEVGSDELRVFLAERLPAAMIPTEWAFLEALPLTPHGKVDRSRLPRPHSERSAIQEARDRTELRLVRLWEEILETQPIGVSDNFFDLGGHSLSAVRLMAAVRRHFGRDLQLAELFRRPTVEMLAEMLRQGDRDRPWSPLVELTTGRAEETPLICIHGGDGHALTFADFARALRAAGDDRPVFALEARGLCHGQRPLESIEEMAELYLAAVREAWPQGPYRLLGYSMGSKVAFEMARRLERYGESVEHLIFLDIPALPRTDAPSDLEIPPEIRSLPDFDPELAGRYLAVWRANLRASHSWTPGQFGGAILLAVAEEGRCAGAPDPTLGWGAVAGGVEVMATPGDHFSLLKFPHVQALAGLVRDCCSADAHLRRNRDEGSALVAL